MDVEMEEEEGGGGGGGQWTEANKQESVPLTEIPL